MDISAVKTVLLGKVSKQIRLRLRRVAKVGLLSATALTFAAPALADIDLVFGAYTADKPTETVRKFKPFLAYLSEEMSERMGERVVITMQIARK